MIEVLRKDAKAALSYGSTVGIDSLREHISERMNDKFSLKTQKDEIIILSGSQQGLDLSGLLFINPGDVVIFEKPSYLGALNAMKPYEAKLIGVNMDDDGLNLEELKKVLDSYGDKVKVIYVNPDHQNPTGRSWQVFCRDLQTRSNACPGICAYGRQSGAAYAGSSYRRELCRLHDCSLSCGV